MNLNPQYLKVKCKDENFIEIDFFQVKKASLLLRALNHPLRRDILRLLETQEKLFVTEIYTQLNIEQSVVSQSLAIMRRAGIVKAERQGKLICYEINHERLQVIATFVEQICTLD